MVCLNRSHKFHRPKLVNDLYESDLFENSIVSLAEIKLPEEEDTSATTIPPPPIQETQETQTSYIENQIIDIETGPTTTKKSATDMTTQTEDCELYEMMGERFTQELEYYKTMNMKKK